MVKRELCRGGKMMQEAAGCHGASLAHVLLHMSPTRYPQHQTPQCPGVLGAPGHSSTFACMVTGEGKGLSPESRIWGSRLFGSLLNPQDLVASREYSFGAYVLTNFHEYKSFF